MGSLGVRVGGFRALVRLGGVLVPLFVVAGIVVLGGVAMMLGCFFVVLCSFVVRLMRLMWHGVFLVGQFPAEHLNTSM